MKLQPHSPDSAVCMRTLGKLCSELGPETVNDFISQFKSLWPSRVSRLNDACASNDHAAGEDAALSLKSAATMAGAYDLANLALLLQSAFRDGQGALQGELIGRIERTGDMILAVLSEPGFAEHAWRTYEEFPNA